MNSLWMFEVALLLILRLEFIKPDTCHFKRHMSATLSGDMTRNNATIYFEDLNIAKDACNSLANQCKGVNMRMSDQSRNFILSSSDRPLYSPGRIAWIRHCEGDCFYSRTSDFIQGIIFKQICPIISTTNTQKTWGRWLQWGSCSQSCGKLGEQKRYRTCSLGESNQDCNEQMFETRVCNYARKCPDTLSNVFGIYGTEGFQHHGNTPIYSTCIRTEQNNKKSCLSSSEAVTREFCTQQLGCCYANDSLYEQLGGPRCFQPKHFIASSGFIDWSIWSPWTPCSLSCRNGTRTRNRICTGSLPNFKACQGPATQTEACNNGVCPCDTKPCRNGGICRPSTLITSGYECECTGNFIGRHCDFGEPRLLCGNDSIVVTFNRGLIEDRGLIDDWRYIHFQGYETSSCFAHTSADGQMYILSIPSPIDRSCGSFMLVTEKEYLIRNKVLWRLTDQSASSTVVLLDLTCSYNKHPNTTAGLDFGIYPTIRTLSFKASRIEFHVTMALYMKADFSPGSLIQSSPTVAEGEVLYVSVNLQALSFAHRDNQVLVLDRCYAADTSENETPVYEFIRNGCATNPIFTTVLMNGLSAVSRWAFRVFEWTSVSRTNDINIVCKVFVCDTEFENCQLSCSENDLTSSSRNVKAGKQLSSEILLVRNDSIDYKRHSITDNFSRQKRQASNKKQEKKNRRSKALREFHHLTVSKRIRSGRLLGSLERDPYSSLLGKLGRGPGIHRSSETSRSPRDVFCSWPVLVFVGFGSIALYVVIKLIVDKLLLSRYRKSS